MSRSTLCLLIPDASYGLGNTEWHQQATDLSAMFGDHDVDVILEEWSSDADLSRHDLTIPLMAWGYHRKLAHWYSQLDRWEDSGARMINPLAVLRWNSDKSYLLDFAAKDVDIIPSILIDSAGANALGQARATFGIDRLVIKPVSSAGSDGTFLLGPGDDFPEEIAGRKMLVQPVMDAIMTEGELSLFMLGGYYSHAIVKRPKNGDFRVQPQFGGMFDAIDPPPAARTLADAAMAASGHSIAYARVDMVADGKGEYALMEIELIEPFLFLERSPDGGAGFVQMVIGLMDLPR